MSNVDRSYYDQVLAGIGAPDSPNNLKYLVAWQLAEGGTATNNAFNTTQGEPGSSDYNSVGVKNYPDAATGIRATIKTLLNGHYPHIVADLQADADPMTTASELGDLSTWGTGNGVQQRLGGPISVPGQGTTSSPTDTSPTATSTPPGSSTGAPGPTTSSKSPLIDTGGIGGGALKAVLYGVATLTGAALIVGGTWRGLQPARDKVTAKAQQVGKAAALAA